MGVKRSAAARVVAALVLAAALACPAAIAAEFGSSDRIAGRVVGIQDGDTLTLVTRERREVRVRAADIDAPESDQPFGDRSKRMLSDLAFSRDAELTVLDVDAYGRPVCRIRVGQENVNAAMVSQGGAWVFTRYNRDPSLVALEAEARTARRGLWGLPEAERVPPWEWRAAKQEEPERRRAAGAAR